MAKSFASKLISRAIWRGADGIKRAAICIAAATLPPSLSLYLSLSLLCTQSYTAYAQFHKLCDHVAFVSRGDLDYGHKFNYIQLRPAAAISQLKSYTIMARGEGAAGVEEERQRRQASTLNASLFVASLCFWLFKVLSGNC